MNNPAVAAIQFALRTEEGLPFLQCWNEGDFAAIRRDWPDAPKEVFIGADPLLPETKALLQEASEPVNTRLLDAAKRQHSADAALYCCPFNVSKEFHEAMLDEHLAAHEALGEAIAAVKQQPARVDLTNKVIDALSKPYAGMGGIEDYRAFARDIIAAHEEKMGGSRNAPKRA